jgi:hypothetical protein
MKRLWAATSVEDVLTTGREQIAEWFDNRLLSHTGCRRTTGVWESYYVPLSDTRRRNTISKVIRDIEELPLAAESIDAAYLYPQLAEAGDVRTPDLYPLWLQREVRKAYARRRLREFAFLCARVRSRHGLVGCFSIAYEYGHSYSAADRAVLGAFAEVTSIALS